MKYKVKIFAKPRQLLRGGVGWIHSYQPTLQLALDYASAIVEEQEEKIERINIDLVG
jgi:hypothetical protein